VAENWKTLFKLWGNVAGVLACNRDPVFSREEEHQSFVNTLYYFKVWYLSKICPEKGTRSVYLHVVWEHSAELLKSLNFKSLGTNYFDCSANNKLTLTYFNS
jgi:hypothetical protein